MPLDVLPHWLLNRGDRRLVVRSMDSCTSTALLFEESEGLFEVQVNQLISLGLTLREADVLRWIIQGKSIPEIAAILSISPRTVSTLLTRVYRQFGVESRHAAVVTTLETLRASKNTPSQSLRRGRA